MMRQIVLAVAAAALAAPWLAGCQTEPVTGRRQLMLIGPAQEIPAGIQAYQEILSQSQLSTDAVDIAILQRVGRRVADAATKLYPNNVQGFEWEFKLIQSPEVNAFCLPGGKVAVYTGILPICLNEAGLAAVVGHEVGHAIAHHGAERMSQASLAQLGAELLAAGTSGRVSPATQQAVMAAYGVGANVGVLLPFSRTQESSADEIGLNLMALCGYDPAEAVKLWQRMAAQESGAPPQFLSTHPASKNRIAALEALQPKALPLYQQASPRVGTGEPLHIPATGPAAPAKK